MKINICGMPHEIKHVTCGFQSGMCGEITYKDCEIDISEGLTTELEKITIIHEVLHGIFTHIGRNDLAEDEALVCSMANAVNQAFELRLED